MWFEIVVEKAIFSPVSRFVVVAVTCNLDHLQPVSEAILGRENYFFLLVVTVGRSTLLLVKALTFGHRGVLPHWRSEACSSGLGVARWSTSCPLCDSFGPRTCPAVLVKPSSWLKFPSVCLLLDSMFGLGHFETIDWPQLPDGFLLSLEAFLPSTSVSACSPMWRYKDISKAVAQK